MMKHLLKREIIGSHIEVIDSENRDLVGINGKIIEETKNTIIVLKNGKRKILLKKQITFTIEMKERKIKIDGSKLIKKPEKRIELK